MNKYVLYLPLIDTHNTTEQFPQTGFQHSLNRL